MIQIEYSKYKPNLKLKKEGDKHYIFDPIRQKYLVLQPEEVVRQLVLQYLIKEKGYKKTHLRTEMMLTINTRRKRCDIVAFDAATKPWLLVECKAAYVEISQDTFDQIARYNLALGVEYLMLTNGLTTYCCQMNHEAETYEFLEAVPAFCF